MSTPDATTTDATADKPKAQSSRTVSDATSSSTAEADTSGSAQTTDSQQTAATTTSTPKVAEASATPTAATTTSTITALRVPSASASPTDVITGFFGSIQGLFEGAALLVRRTFFNEAPTVTPVQLTGETTGPITGKVGAVDPEGDKMVYKVAQQGHYGTVTVDANGNYTYTPDDPGANIVDSFVVSATDTGPHINLLNWFRTPSTYAAGSIYQEPANTPRITYVFTYGNGSQFWSSAARAELAATAIYLSSYFEPQHDVTITYAVTGQYSLAGSTLASAGSDLISDQGFAETVVQHKILTGEDLNGSAADGTIDWNFGYGWGYFSTVPAGSYDFQSTAMHELLHTYGFLSVIDSAGNNSIENWTTFDKFVVDKYGNSVWTGPNDTTFNSTAYNSNLTGGNGGLYFGGPTLPTTYAYQANQNNPVPLYTPNPWESGSSMSHLNDNYYNGSSDLRPEMLMNAASDTGPGVTKLSDIEIGIMADLGYKMVGLSNATMVSASPTVAVLFIGLMLVRRRKTAKSA
ncbi:Ig-like domain-containing protein [Mycobacterium crocinum]|uniref:Ig-like domain-containing protein n=1 Tax=Mycolicibacterium crocinum TaxID=388459 RepID=A0ABY3TJU2_9MYCO|nr:Ig-like domain-containing protein [Mycolicibacterium crocinum]MCV7216066.1 Ig-like domain-containing protein [Mycolicibacterium crocinum]ULN41007.1 Ig-like domain-containing protein [Mycolicibacterium crocinum]